SCIVARKISCAFTASPVIKKQNRYSCAKFFELSCKASNVTRMRLIDKGWQTLFPTQCSPPPPHITAREAVNSRAFANKASFCEESRIQTRAATGSNDSRRLATSSALERLLKA